MINNIDIIYAGRLLKHKNVDMLIKAINELNNQRSNYTCLIIGEGPEKTKLIKLAEKFELTENSINSTTFMINKKIYMHM